MIATEYGPAGAAADGQAAGAAAAGGAGAADIDTQEDAELAALAGAAAAAAAGPDEPERAFPTPPRPAVQPALAAAAPVRPAPAAAGARPAAAGGSALDRRLMPQGNGVTTGTLAQRPAAAQQQLQQVGQKRLHPTSVGANPAAAAAAAAAGSGGRALLPAKRAHTGAQPGQQQQQRQLQQQAGSRSAAAAGSRVGGGGGWVLPPPGVAPVLEVQVALVTVQRPDAPQQDQYQSVTLLVENRRGPGAGGSGAACAAGCAEVSLHLGGMPGHVFWRDRLQEQVGVGRGWRAAAVAPVCCTSALLSQMEQHTICWWCQPDPSRDTHCCAHCCAFPAPALRAHRLLLLPATCTSPQPPPPQACCTPGAPRARPCCPRWPWAARLCP